MAISLLLLLLSVLGNGADYMPEPALDSREQEAVYKVLEAINSAIDWRGLFPDNLCIGGSHGVVCDLDTQCFMHKIVTIPAFVWAALAGGGVEELIFQDNPALQGFLTPELGMLTGLRRFILSGMSMGGTVPAEIGNLKNLRQLVLSSNSFSGRILESIGGLKELVILDLNRNWVEGCVPMEFGELACQIDLSYNQFQGALPTSLVHLQAVEFIDLSFNNLSGVVPLFLAELSKLRYLHFSGNPELEGIIPDIWGTLPKLRSLGLSFTGLVGRIPSSIGSLKDLNYLALDNNKLEGTIPTEFGSTPQIYEMNLSANELTGLVPFSTSFIKKMGRKLGLEGNYGLFYDLKAIVGRSKEAQHLNSCFNSSLQDSVVQDSKLQLPVSGSVSNLPKGRMKFELFVRIFPATLICAIFL